MPETPAQALPTRFPSRFSSKPSAGADAAVEYIAAQLASGTIRSDEAEEIWKLLRASGESDI